MANGAFIAAATRARSRMKLKLVVMCRLIYRAASRAHTGPVLKCVLSAGARSTARRLRCCWQHSLALFSPTDNGLGDVALKTIVPSGAPDATFAPLLRESWRRSSKNRGCVPDTPLCAQIRHAAGSATAPGRLRLRIWRCDARSPTAVPDPQSAHGGVLSFSSPLSCSLHSNTQQRTCLIRPFRPMKGAYLPTA
jgi:hypothetical protein